MKTKSMLIEAFLASEVVLCWIVALPVLVLCLSGFMIWEKAAAVVLRGPLGPAGTGMSPVTA